MNRTFEILFMIDNYLNYLHQRISEIKQQKHKCACWLQIKGGEQTKVGRLE